MFFFCRARTHDADVLHVDPLGSGFMSLREFTGKSMKSCTYEIGKVVV